MNADKLKNYIGIKSLTVVEAMQKIDENSAGILYIIDDNLRLIGSLTDGDIRRWIIKTGDLTGQAAQAMHKNVTFLFEGAEEKCDELMSLQQLSSIPIVNADKEITNIIFLNDLKKHRKKSRSMDLFETPVIIMAGGKGTRLYPYTKILPKPLIPIGDIPILERILNRFYRYGANEFYLTVNYKKEMIKSYFNDLKPKYTIHYVEEKHPLGTAGSIRLIDEIFVSPVIITNCDVLIEADYGKLLKYHKTSGNAMTIVSSLKNMTIPYGVLRSQEKGIVISMEEKPQLSYFVNTGMYIVNPEHLKIIPNECVFHMTDLAEQLMKKGLQVGMYPVSENAFLDMGEFEEMKRMEKRISNDTVK